MFSTIHIFGYGETQIIAENLNLKVKSNELTKLTDLINHIKALRPEDTVDSDYHVIHIFNGSRVMYLSHSEDQDQKKTFVVDFDSIDSSILDPLVQEILSKQ